MTDSIDSTLDEAESQTFVEWWLSQGEWAENHPYAALLFLLSQLVFLLVVLWVVINGVIL